MTIAKAIAHTHNDSPILAKNWTGELKGEYVDLGVCGTGKQYLVKILFPVEMPVEVITVKWGDESLERVLEIHWFENLNISSKWSHIGSIEKVSLVSKPWPFSKCPTIKLALDREYITRNGMRQKIDAKTSTGEFFSTKDNITYDSDGKVCGYQSHPLEIVKEFNGEII